MKPIRNLKYLAWIRTLPCLVCGRTTGIEAAHTGPHGIAQKSSDTSVVPLCARHHRTGRDSHHKLGPRAFERHHRIDLRAITAHLNRRPSIRIDDGCYVLCYQDDESVLGPVRIGLAVAVHKALLIKREDRAYLSAEPAIADFFQTRQRLQTT